MQFRENSFPVCYVLSSNPFTVLSIQEQKEEKIEVEEGGSVDGYISLLRQPFPSSATVDRSGACDIYLDFLKSIIYGRVIANQSLMDWVPGNVRKMSRSLCDYLTAYRYVRMSFFDTSKLLCIV